MKSFKKSYTIHAPASAVFEALTDAKMITEWSGAATRMNAREGTAFSLWDGSIVGKNISISENEIVQYWKEEDWPEYSKVIFTMNSKGPKTIVELKHEGIPDESFEDIKEGWDEYYMLPLKELVEAKNSQKH